MSTKAVFEKIDSEPIPCRPDIKAITEAIEKSSLSDIAKAVYNVFEPPVSLEVPEICDIKKILLENGAMTAAMTGSGSAVFGIFDSESVAQSAADALLREYADVFVATPVSADKVREVIVCE